MGGALLAVALGLVSSNDLDLMLFFTRTSFGIQFARSLVDILALMQNPDLVNESSEILCSKKPHS
jgi:hypothetical protein